MRIIMGITKSAYSFPLIIWKPLRNASFGGAFGIYYVHEFCFCKTKFREWD